MLRRNVIRLPTGNLDPIIIILLPKTELFEEAKTICPVWVSSTVRLKKPLLDHMPFGFDQHYSTDYAGRKTLLGKLLLCLLGLRHG